ncbi:MAG: J domain-containing protein [Acidobacteriota bacterium]
MSSAFARLWRIARANIDGRRDGGAEPVVDASGVEDRQSQAQQSATQPPAADVDPELARYYANLEVPYGSDLATVREAWKLLMRKYHPDLHGADAEKQRTATELVKGLNQALEQLERRLGTTN